MRIYAHKHEPKSSAIEKLHRSCRANLLCITTVLPLFATIHLTRSDHVRQHAAQLVAGDFALDSTVPLAVRVRVRAFAVVDDGKGREMRQWLPIRYGRKAPARNATAAGPIYPMKYWYATPNHIEQGQGEGEGKGHYARG